MSVYHVYNLSKYPKYYCTHLNKELYTRMCAHDAHAVHCNRVRAELEVAKQKTKEEDDVSVLPFVHYI